MRKLIINGPDKYPGANYFVIGKNQSKINLQYGNRRKIAEDLQIGDIVERHLANNDVVLFNR
jgi:DNA-directed RNA polymerase III subunit RPC1